MRFRGPIGILCNVSWLLSIISCPQTVFPRAVFNIVPRLLLRFSAVFVISFVQFDFKFCQYSFRSL